MYGLVHVPPRGAVYLFLRPRTIFIDIHYDTILNSTMMLDSTWFHERKIAKAASAWICTFKWTHALTFSYPVPNMSPVSRKSACGRVRTGANSPLHSPVSKDAPRHHRGLAKQCSHQGGERRTPCDCKRWADPMGMAYPRSAVSLPGS